MKDAVTGPPPGTSPSRKPRPLPRSMGRHAARQSAGVGQSPRMRSASTVFFASVSTLTSTSARPNRPITTASRSMPPPRLTEPKAKRSLPFTTSRPTAAARKPSATMSTPFTADPVIMKSVHTRPSTISAKFSGGPKRIAAAAMSGAKNVITTTPTVPAMNEPIAAMPSAAPARPWRHLVAVDAGHHGSRFAGDVEQHRGGRAAVHRAVENRAQHHHPADRRQRERDRQEQRQRGQRPEPRQHADQGADHAADEAEIQVLRRQDDG